MEAIHLRSTPLTMPNDVPHFDHLASDPYASTLLHTYTPEVNSVPLSVSGDGNYFFNAISVAFAGNEDLAGHLHCRCCR